MKRLLPILFVFLASPLAAQITGGSGTGSIPAGACSGGDLTGSYPGCTVAGVAGATQAIHTSSTVFMGLQISTQAAGGAGTAVTAICPATTFALGGGCSCSVIVAATGVISIPNVVTPGGIASGWTCQVAGGTGGQCSAYAICARMN